MGRDNILNWTTYSGAGAAITGALTVNQWLGIGGFILALAGFAVNVWYKRAMYRLAKKEQRLKYPNS